MEATPIAPPRGNSNARITTPIKRLSIAEAAYLAGLIDADGSIGGKYASSGAVTYRVVIGQKDREVLDWVLETVGAGRIRRQKRTSSYKPLVFHSYILTAKTQVLDLVSQLSPYLIVKQRQAKLVQADQVITRSE